ncbi:MAG TPA: hypothetical protein VJ385_18575 [Fibrobacteria bacterium]|nr:hypothetical protein [Fibrobacteria bacterium]
MKIGFVSEKPYVWFSLEIEVQKHAPGSRPGKADSHGMAAPVLKGKNSVTIWTSLGDERVVRQGNHSDSGGFSKLWRFFFRSKARGSGPDLDEPSILAFDFERAQ